jgi:uncharacterized RDD family membrane protein YckC
MIYRKRQEWFLNQEQSLATVKRRFFAIIIDFVFIFFLYFLIIQVMNWFGYKIENLNLNFFKEPELEAAGMNKSSIHTLKISLGFVPTIYFALFTFFTNGFTPGKKIIGIRIISLYHQRIGLWHCIERSLGYVASALESGLGFIQALWNPNRMALHDRIAETVVIRVKSGKQKKKYPRKKPSHA